MPREEEGVARLLFLKRHLVHGPALHDAGIPVNEDAALHVGAADKARAVNAPAGFAAPAVLRAHVFLGLLTDGGTEHLLAAAVPTVQGFLHQLCGGDAFLLCQRLVKRQTLFLREHSAHLIPHRFQRHIPDIANAAIHQPHLGPALVGLGLLGRFRHPAQQAAPLQLHHPDALHLGQVEDIGGPSRQDHRLREVVPQGSFLEKLQLPGKNIAVVAVKADHLGHIRGQMDSGRRHAAGGSAHLTGLPVESLIANGGDRPRFALLDGLGQIVNGAYRHGKQCVFHVSLPSSSCSSSSGRMDRMVPSAVPVTVSASDCLACCNSTIFSSMVSCAMSLYTCTGFCCPMR